MFHGAYDEETTVPYEDDPLAVEGEDAMAAFRRKLDFEYD